MGLFLSIFFGFAPIFLFACIIYWLDRYEKEPKRFLGAVFLWGAIFAAGAAFIVNTTLGVGVYMFTHSEAASSLTTSFLVAPVVEEFLKGLAVLFVFLAFRHEFDSIMDGIVYAAIAALGFAATENAYYIYNYGYLENGFTGLLWLTFVRVFLVGWQHPFYTAFFGIGLAVARLNRNVWVWLLAPIGGWSIAVILHSIHNTLANILSGASGAVLGTIWDWTGWFFMLLFILWALQREQKWIVAHLREEVNAGVISLAQYRIACSAWSQWTARFEALFSGSYRRTNRFYQLCAELAYKKQQKATLGEEGDNSLRISRLRSELAKLSPYVSL